MDMQTDSFGEIGLVTALAYVRKNIDSDDHVVKTAMKICIIKLGEEYLKVLSLLEASANVMADAQRKLESFSERGFSDSSISL